MEGQRDQARWQNAADRELMGARTGVTTAGAGGAAGALMVIAEILVTSIVGEALFTVVWDRAFDRYWSHLGEAATAVVEPAWGAAEAFGVLAFGLLFVFGPLVAIGYGLLYMLPKRWFEWGRWRGLPDDWFRQNPLITRRRARRFVVGGAALAIVGWPVVIIAAAAVPPVVIVLLVVPFAVLALDWFRALTRRSRLAAIVGFLILVTVMPTVVAAFSRPRIDRTGDQQGLLFEADGLSPAHLSTPHGERPIVILGATVLGDIVIYDTCLDNGNAQVVAREDIVVPTTLTTCP